MRVAGVSQRLRGKSYAETFRCPGGALCLDFCNSGQGALDRNAREWLTQFDDLLLWLEAAGALGAEQAKRFAQAGRAAPERARALLARALALRETLRRAFEASARGEPPACEALAQIAAEHARVARFARIAWRDGHAHWELDPAASEFDALLEPLVQSAVDLLTSHALERVRRCGNPTCYWLFVDETRNRSRRWCEMASCGNLHKVRRHRERARRTATGGARARTGTRAA